MPADEHVLGTGVRLIGFALLAALAGCGRPQVAAGDWSVYGGSQGTRYSTLTQIDRSNVKTLRHAWTFAMDEQGESQTHPLAIEGTIYAYTPALKVIALDGATGMRIWQFDSGIEASGPSRGLAHWMDSKERRLFASVMNYLYALDPATGEPIESFGEGGRIDLRAGLGRDAAKVSVSMTSPGVIYQDMIIVGFRTGEAAPAAPGDIRAFDVRTGKLRWTFHTIPRPGEPGQATWPADAWRTAGGANPWSGLVLDADRGIVYAATGSAVNDFYGADRAGDNLFANTLLALNAQDGARLWHFQGVHHDVLDRDFPALPVLLSIRRDGQRVDALAQPTKQGFLFVLDRLTGKPIFPIEEHAYPQSETPGEATSRTQPRAMTPQPYSRQFLREDMLTRRTPQAHAWALARFKEFRSEGPFTPLSVGKQTIVFPGFDGGAQWGGAAADPRSGVIFINANDVAWTGGLIERTTFEGKGSAVYNDSCSTCHGADRAGSPPAFPSLVGIDSRMTREQIETVIRAGRGRMPSFAGIGKTELDALTRYLSSGEDASSAGAGQSREAPAPAGTGNRARYTFTGYKKFLDPDGYPAVEPPWGTLNAIDLNTGEYLWKIPLGQYPELAAQGIADTGSENYGGPLVTASGLLFIGATVYDKKFRAFDAATGALLWEATLSFAATATPMTYMADGRQFLVIATSNARDRKAPQGSAYVALALPE